MTLQYLEIILCRMKNLRPHLDMALVLCLSLAVPTSGVSRRQNRNLNRFLQTYFFGDLLARRRSSFMPRTRGPERPTMRPICSELRFVPLPKSFTASALLVWAFSDVCWSPLRAAGRCFWGGCLPSAVCQFVASRPCISL